MATNVNNACIVVFWTLPNNKYTTIRSCLVKTPRGEGQSPWVTPVKTKLIFYKIQIKTLDFLFAAVISKWWNWFKYQPETTNLSSCHHQQLWSCHHQQLWSCHRHQQHFTQQRQQINSWSRLTTQNSWPLPERKFHWNRPLEWKRSVACAVGIWITNIVLYVAAI